MNHPDQNGSVAARSARQIKLGDEEGSLDWSMRRGGTEIRAEARLLSVLVLTLHPLRQMRFRAV